MLRTYGTTWNDGRVRGIFGVAPCLGLTLQGVVHRHSPSRPSNPHGLLRRASNAIRIRRLRSSAPGDIAGCKSLEGAQATAKLIEKIPGTVFAAGDLAYERGTAAEFRDCYGTTWGRFKNRTRPALGNHEYGGDTPPPIFSTGAIRPVRRQGLLQLRSRRLAHHRAEHELRGSRAWEAAVRALRKSSGYATTSAIIPTLASSPTGTTRCSAAASSDDTRCTPS